MNDRVLDVVTIGRASVDLYGRQIGSRLEDIASFEKAVGGCPANIAIGCARLGLRSALVTRVGDEQMGRFIREQLVREGVAIDAIKTDPERLTALVLLSVEDEGVSPMIFYRTDCADMALSEEDIDEPTIAAARSVVVTGTHFSSKHSEAAQLKAIRIARANGNKVVFDIDYRPNLWGLAGHEAGFARYMRSERVSATLRPVLAECDLVVGTEEEVMIAAGTEDLLAALDAIRALTPATIVLKRGAMGCVVYDGEIPRRLDQDIVGRGFEIEVYNVLGAGDAFLAGFLRGWLGGETLETAATWGNACGALAVSRLLCSPEYPTWAELQHFLDKASPHRALRRDRDLAHIHWATTRRRPTPAALLALACDHRPQFEAMADAAGASRDRISDFKVLAVEAAAMVASGRPGYGILLDDRYGRKALFAAGRHDFSLVARPVEEPGSCPLAFEDGQGMGARLVEWPLDHTVKCLCLYHPDDPAGLKRLQREKLVQLFAASRAIGRELLVEVVSGRSARLGDDTVARAIEELYAAGIKPDWWKLERQPSASAWKNIDTVIAANDRWCRGVLMLGLDAPLDEFEAAFELAAGATCLRGFAVGRSIFGETARRWFKGEASDAEAVADMAGRFKSLTESWLAARGRRAA